MSIAYVKWNETQYHFSVNFCDKDLFKKIAKEAKWDTLRKIWSVTCSHEHAAKDIVSKFTAAKAQKKDDNTSATIDDMLQQQQADDAKKRYQQLVQKFESVADYKEAMRLYNKIKFSAKVSNTPSKQKFTEAQNEIKLLIDKLADIGLKSDGLQELYALKYHTNINPANITCTKIVTLLAIAP